MAATRPALMTVDDLLELPDDDQRRVELLRGECLEMPPAGFEHSHIGGWILFHINRYLLEHPIGAAAGEGAGFIIQRDPDTLLSPDVAFVSNERLPPPEERTGYLHAVPDLVVEVVSPSDRYSNITDKVLLYLEHGARLVWVIHPSQRAATVYNAASPDTAHILRGDDMLDGGDVLPGFQIPLSALFR
jgi:Uma2 family endonuclease